jgi:hypothetical protein
MGEIADMMLDGTLCEACGEYIGEGEGFPRYCSEECARNRGVGLEEKPKRKEQIRLARSPIVKCPICGKMTRGLEQHTRDKHGKPEKHDKEGPEKKQDGAGPTKPKKSAPIPKPERPKLE